MFISQFQLSNYKSFLNTGLLSFSPGFNLVWGPNSVGKTALLEGLSLHFNGNPHRSLRTVPFPDAQPPQRAEGIYRVVISNEEFRDLLSSIHDGIFVPVPNANSNLARQIGFDVNRADRLDRLGEWLIKESQYVFEYKVVAEPNKSSAVEQSRYPALIAIEPPGDARLLGQTRIVLPLRWESDGSLAHESPSAVQENREFGQRFRETLRQRVYYFHAQRLNVGKYSFGINRTLNPNASNLAEVLNNLQHNRDRFAEFNRLVHAIIPQIQWVSVRSAPSNEVEIVVWNHNPATQREDLAFPLNESGTGIGQILAILYVMLTSHNSRTVIIDEPQTFLHRGAVRKLIEILKLFPQHQYIIATHSPTVISATNPSTITLVRQTNGESTAETLDATDISNQRLFLSEVGARPADVFGYDNILWVEGETEEVCFPTVYERVAKKSLMGTAIRRVKHTGDFETKDANIIFDIYERLSHGKSLLPPAIGFLFDDECRTNQERDDIKKRGGGKVYFLQRRMYENYLLNPEAIATVINEAMTIATNYSGPAIKSADVQQLINNKVSDKSYFKKAESKTGGSDWVNHIHGAKLLEDIFSELTQDKAPLSFDKVRHGLALTEWLIANAPAELAEVAGAIEAAMSS